MKLDYVPLLQIQRELHDIPPGMGRFREYLRTIWSPDGTDGELLPLLIMNPMGRGHVAALLDALLALDADGLAARAAAEAASQLADVSGGCKLALVVADDLRGGGTNRYDYEFTLRFGPARPRSRAGPTRRSAPTCHGGRSTSGSRASSGPAKLPRSGRSARPC
jgi:hypothetical protein